MLVRFSLYRLSNAGESGENYKLHYIPVFGRESNMGTDIDEKDEGEEGSAHNCWARRYPRHGI